jgi:hypothetical protein
MFPGRSKEWGSHHEKSTTGTNVQGNKKIKMEHCPDRVCVQQDFLLQVLKGNQCEKTLERKML